MRSGKTTLGSHGAFFIRIPYLYKAHFYKVFLPKEKQTKQTKQTKQIKQTECAPGEQETAGAEDAEQLRQAEQIEAANSKSQAETMQAVRLFCFCFYRKSHFEERAQRATRNASPLNY